jgi:hypothetical protein
MQVETLRKGWSAIRSYACNPSGGIGFACVPGVIR